MNVAQLKEIDTFMRKGRIGPVLLELYNEKRRTRRELEQARFIAFKGDDGQARVAIAVMGDLLPILVGSLHLYVGSRLTREERSFFARFDIGWD